MKNTEIKILVVSQRPAIAHRISSLFDGEQIDLRWESRIDRVLDLFERSTYDILLITDAIIQDGRIESIEVLEILSAKCPVTQILFLVDPKNIAIVSTALQVGTYQYIKTPVSDQELQLLVKAALEQQTQFGENQLLKRENGGQQFTQLIGQSQPMQDVYRQIRQAASTDIPVLILGETGTGKDLVAHIIHQQSSRSKNAYVPLNIAALPSELVVSELFGHEKGTFTGATENRVGIFEQADQGTVFLDEIGSIDERGQISLLRLLEQKRFHRLGGRRLIKSDVRLIAATNADLAELVQQSLFREDLFFRLDVFRIHLPSLRQRQGDIILLIDEFLQRFSSAFQKDIRGIAPECILALEAYKWPGNIRELRNVLQRAVLQSQSQTLLLENLPARFRDNVPKKPEVSFEIGTSLEYIERKMIERTLQFARNNRKKAALLLGISRGTLYNKMTKYDLA